MPVVLQYDARSKITYAYHNEPYWDKDLKRPRSSRTLIGRINAETGEIIPTAGKRRQKPINEDLVAAEIAKYNESIRQKKQKETDVVGVSDKELELLKRQYSEMKKKYDEFGTMMVSFANTIQDFFK